MSNTLQKIKMFLVLVLLGLPRTATAFGPSGDGGWTIVNQLGRVPTDVQHQRAIRTCWLNVHGDWDPHKNGYCNHTSGLKLADTTTPRPGTCSGTVQ